MLKSNGTQSYFTVKHFETFLVVEQTEGGEGGEKHDTVICR